MQEPTFDLPSRPSPYQIPRPQIYAGQRPSFPHHDGISPLPGSMFNVVSGKGWGSPDNVPTDADTDTSGGQASSGPSPEQSSSNTSYSPPSTEDDAISAQTNPYRITEPAPGGADPVFKYTDLATNLVSMLPTEQQQSRSDFTPSSSWAFDPTAASSTPSQVSGNIAGMTPGADGDWSQLLDNMDNMDNMVWENSTFGADEDQWRPPNGSTNRPDM
ncbi:MAG: hypothetical protein Q9183_002050 [Haloplaca sp. 2 TL-2023]